MKQINWQHFHNQIHQAGANVQAFHQSMTDTARAMGQESTAWDGQLNQAHSEVVNAETQRLESAFAIDSEYDALQKQYQTEITANQQRLADLQNMADGAKSEWLK